MSPAALAKLSMRPVCSHLRKSYGMVTSRLVVRRGSQKRSSKVTSVKATGVIG